MIRALLITLFLTSCSVFNPVEPITTTQYQIEPNIEKNTCNTKNKNSIQINQMQAIDHYNSYSMYYQNTKYKIASYVYSNWITFPQNMLTQSIYQKLLQSCLFNLVINSDFISQAQYRLSSQLIELIQDTVANQVKLVISVKLVDNKNNYIIKAKEFSYVVPSVASPTGFAASTSLATEKFLTNLDHWLKLTIAAPLSASVAN